MSKRDLFDKKVLDDIVDDSSLDKQRIRMLAGCGICYVTSAVCFSQAIEHASAGNYGQALVLGITGAMTLAIGYNEARCANILYVTPIEELKPPLLEIDVQNPVSDYLDD